MRTGYRRSSVVCLDYFPIAIGRFVASGHRNNPGGTANGVSQTFPGKQKAPKPGSPQGVRALCFGPKTFKGVFSMKPKIKPRNPFVALAKFRKAGTHGKPAKSLRRQARQSLAKSIKQSPVSWHKGIATQCPCAMTSASPETCSNASETHAYPHPVRPPHRIRSLHTRLCGRQRGCCGPGWRHRVSSGSTSSPINGSNKSWPNRFPGGRWS
jgi:hypothetical protein